MRKTADILLQLIAEIINFVWGTQESIGVTDQALDALVRRLRDRLAELDPQYQYIITVRGQGFRLDNPPFTGNLEVPQ